LVSWYVTPTLKKWFEPQRVVYDFFEAPHPWGPWAFVSSLDDRFLAPPAHMYGPNLCAKYQQAAGDDVIVSLFTSGCPFADVPTGIYKNWRIPLTLKRRPMPPTSVINDDDRHILYQGHWHVSRKRGYHDYHDDIHWTNTPGDAASYAFSGTGIALWSEKFADQGQIAVFLDGRPRGTVNLKDDDFPRLVQIPVFEAAGLPPGRHVIRIVNSGSAYVAVDTFAVTAGTR
jgi:hypothetical protein